MSTEYEEPTGPEPAYDRIVSGYETFHHPTPLDFEWGGTLPSFSLAYETWGELNADKSNAILLHTGLSASSHARSHVKNERPGWWEEFIGPGLALDTDRYHVVCTNLIGGCYGSTGPASTDPVSGDPYGPDFPIVTVVDMLRTQFLLLDYLGIDKVHACVGASLGGMQSLMAAAMYPERVQRMVSISAAAYSHPLSIAMRFVQRSALMADPAWMGGRYHGRSFPHAGLKVAREIGTITYRSGPEWEERFGRQRREGTPVYTADFDVESYLAYQGDKFCQLFDPNSYLTLSKAMDLFDLSDGQESLEIGVGRIQCPSLIIGVRSDILFPCWQQHELATLLEAGGAETTMLELDAPYGHDTFLIEVEAVGNAVRAHLEAGPER